MKGLKYGVQARERLNFYQPVEVNDEYNDDLKNFLGSPRDYVPKSLILINRAN